MEVKREIIPESITRVHKNNKLTTVHIEKVTDENGKETFDVITRTTEIIKKLKTNENNAAKILNAHIIPSTDPIRRN